jgi:uncharacterized protein YcfL
MKKTIVSITALLLTGCGSEITQFNHEVKAMVTNINDPTERGLAYVAGAIIISSIIRGFLNK